MNGSNEDDSRQAAIDVFRILSKEGTYDPEEFEEEDRNDQEQILRLVRAPSSRYQTGSWATAGGMGRLTDARDLLLDRRVVRKRPRARSDEHVNWRAFVHEAQVTAQLNHPAIVPLLEMGRDAEGFYYLMPWVEGRTLHEVIDGLKQREAQLRRKFELPRLLHVFRTVCGAIAHAHSKGIIHRDLKPDQILLGPHDEVIVVDWGLAARLGREALAPNMRASRTPQSASSLRSGKTVLKGVHGAPRYQPPERLVPSAIPADPAQDVYSLGAILHCILTLEPPVRWPADNLPEEAFLADLRQQIRHLTPPSTRSAWESPPSPQWDTICARCLEVRPRDRFEDASQLFEAAEDALSEAEKAERRRTHVGEAIIRGDKALADLREMDRNFTRIRQQRRDLQAALPAHRPLEEKRPLWDLQDREVELDRERSKTLAEVERLFELALSHDPAHAGSKSGLADLYLERLREAEASGDLPSIGYYHARMLRFDDGSREKALSRPARLSVGCESVEATVRIAEFDEIERRLVPGSWRDLGGSLLHEVDVKPGRFAIEVNADGRACAKYALRIEPGEELHLRPSLPAVEAIPEGFVYVPAGPCWVGGDPLSIQAGPLGHVDLPDFAIGKYPVSMEDYRVFVESLPASEAESRVPRDNVDGSLLWRKSNSNWEIPQSDNHGDPCSPSFPVFLVRAVDAEAYAVWLSARQNREYRLPYRNEWEYAARAGDRRLYPWGDRFEPHYCWGRERQPGSPVPADIGFCPFDESPTGVRDLAGNVGDWLLDDFSPSDPLRHVAGGAWFGSEHFVRLPRRFGYNPMQRSAGIGFRLLLPF